MRDGRQALSIRFEDSLRGPLAQRALNDISVDFMSVLESGRLLVLPQDLSKVRGKLEEAGFLIMAVDRVDISDDEAWLLSAADLDDLEALYGEDDEIAFDFDVLDGDGLRF